MNKIIAKNTLMLYIMAIAKMVFPLITLPYLARVLSVPAYGVVAYVKAVMQYMQLIVDFGFLLSGTKDIVLAGNDKNAINREVGDVMLAKLILSFASLLILCSLIPFIEILRNNVAFTLLSFLVVFLTIFLMDFFFRGIERMEVITIRFVVMKSISTILTFILVKNDNDLLWIPILDIIGSLVAVVLVFWELNKLNVRLKPTGLRAAFIKLKESAVYFMSHMATTAFNALNTVLIGIFISTSDVAYWSLCMQLIGAVQSLYTPITNGIYPQMIRSKDRSIIVKTAKLVMPIVTLGCLFTVFVARYVLLIVGGEKYVVATNILQLLVPVLFFSFPAILYGWPALGPIEKQKETTTTTIISASFQTIGLFLLIVFKRFELITIALLRDVTEAVLFGSRYYVYRKNLDKYKN